MTKAKNSDTVSVHYTGRLEDGQIFDSSINREPLSFTIGQGQMIPGFEKGVLDMEINEKKTIHIPCAEAYGERNEEMLHEVGKDQLPEDMQPEIGMTLVATTPEGYEHRLVVAEVHEEFVVLDANHPLAGKDLIFDIELMSIN